MYRLALVTILAVLVNLPAHADNSPVTVPTEILKAWVPIGFDSNDRVEVLVDGMLPNTCFRVGPYSTKVDSSSKTILLQQNVDTYLGVCLQMLIPFSQVMELGNIEPGNYTLIDETSGKTLGTLPVERATSQNIDDYWYADVRDTWMGKDAASGRATMTFSFDLPSKCSRFKEAIVHYYPEVIVVQPVMERIGEKACGKTLDRAQVKVELKDGVHGTYLLHVRSMSGKAISKLVDIE